MLEIAAYPPMTRSFIETKSGEKCIYDRRKLFSENVKRELHDSKVTGRKSLSLILKRIRAAAKRLRALRLLRKVPVVKDGEVLYSEIRGPTPVYGFDPFMQPGRTLRYVRGMPLKEDLDDMKTIVGYNEAEWPKVRHYDRLSLAKEIRRSRRVFTSELIDLEAGVATKLRGNRFKVPWIVRYRSSTVYDPLGVNNPKLKKVPNRDFGFSCWCTHENNDLRIKMRALSNPPGPEVQAFCPRFVRIREVLHNFWGSTSSTTFREVDAPRVDFQAPSLFEWAKVNEFIAMHITDVDQYYCGRCRSVFQESGHILRVGGCTIHKRQCDTVCLKKQIQPKRRVARLYALGVRKNDRKKTLRVPRDL